MLPPPKFVVLLDRDLGGGGPIGGGGEADFPVPDMPDTIGDETIGREPLELLDDCLFRYVPPVGARMKHSTQYVAGNLSTVLDWSLMGSSRLLARSQLHHIGRNPSSLTLGRTRLFPVFGTPVPLTTGSFGQQRCLHRTQATGVLTAAIGAVCLQRDDEVHGDSYESGVTRIDELFTNCMQSLT